MPSLVFDKCCGYIKLKTGCFIVGYFNLVACLILTVLTIITIVDATETINAPSDSIVFDMIIKGAAVAARIMSIILLIFVQFAMAFAIVLLVGLYKNKPGCLKAYMIYSVIFIVIFAIIELIHLFSYSMDSIVIGVIIICILAVVLQIYFLLVIRSMYYHMKNPPCDPDFMYSAI